MKFHSFSPPARTKSLESETMRCSSTGREEIIALIVEVSLEQPSQCSLSASLNAADMSRPTNILKSSSRFIDFVLMYFSGLVHQVPRLAFSRLMQCIMFKLVEEASDLRCARPDLASLSSDDMYPVGKSFASTSCSFGVIDAPCSFIQSDQTNMFVFL